MSDTRSHDAHPAPAGAAGSPGPEALAPPSYRQHQVLGAGALIAAVVLYSYWQSDALALGMVTQWATYALAGTGFYLVFGLSGQFAFSQAAFMGIGAYTSAKATGAWGFVPGVLTAIVVSVAVALVFSWIVRRSSEFYFAIATLALSYLALIVFREWEWVGGHGGEVLGIPRPDLFGWEINSDRGVLFLTLAVLFVGLVLTALIERSPLRRSAMAFRDKHQVAAANGLPVVWLRYAFFALGSSFAAVAGALSAHRSGFASPESFSLELGINLFLVLLLGGIGSMWGASLGAAFVVFAPEYLRFVGQYQSLVYGLILVVVVLAMPKGLIGFADLLPWRRRAHRQDLTVLEVDGDADADR